MDELLELDLKRYSMKRVPDGPYGPRYRPSSGSAPQLFFDKETLGRLANSVGQLNSDAINDCAQLLQGFYNDVPTTIFSTFLPLAHYVPLLAFSSCDEQSPRFEFALVMLTRRWTTKSYPMPSTSAEKAR